MAASLFEAGDIRLSMLQAERTKTQRRLTVLSGAIKEASKEVRRISALEERARGKHAKDVAVKVAAKAGHVSGKRKGAHAAASSGPVPHPPAPPHVAPLLRSPRAKHPTGTAVCWRAWQQ